MIRDHFGFRAGVVDEWPTDTARLHVVRGIGVGQTDVLMQDGTWQVVGDDVEATGAGIVLPRPAIAAIYDAMCEYRGLRPHQATEAKVLREWLAVEQRRVDGFLGRA